MELIVVLVILAILAAILIPALLGYIDKAREKQITTDANAAYTALQSQLDELYGTATVGMAAQGTVSATDIYNLAGIKNTFSIGYQTKTAYDSKKTTLDKTNFEVGYFVFQENGKVAILLADGSWHTQKATDTDISAATDAIAITDAVSGQAAAASGSGKYTASTHTA